MTDAEKVDAARLPAIVTTVAELRRRVTEARFAGLSIGCVPTMGALHAGHVSLVKASRKRCGFTVVTIFVNPTQFGPREDFGKYPRQLEKDLALLAPEGVDLVFAPPVGGVYPDGFATFVDVEGPATVGLEGPLRPGHFRGVATVVLKLFLMVQPDVAFFGQKDFQQTVVVRRMTRDLDVPVEIAVMPTLRDPDGLAMSSRNVYLSVDERAAALVISQALFRVEARVAEGERAAETLLAALRETLANRPEVAVQYAEIVDCETLAPIERIERPAVALIAAKVGATRLIDNLVLTPR
ncbi:MAG TPA: pantoate--beta-alanine ligase [Pirellulales bacterium]